MFGSVCLALVVTAAGVEMGFGGGGLGVLGRITGLSVSGWGIGASQGPQPTRLSRHRPEEACKGACKDL